MQIRSRMDESGGIKANYGQRSHQQRHMEVCSLCGISAHSLRVEWERKIHIIEPLAKMSCFQIAHSSYCTGLWTTRGQEVETFMRQGKLVKKACYYLNTSHQVYQSIMASYGLIRTKRRIGCNSSDEEDHTDVENNVYNNEVNDDNEDFEEKSGDGSNLNEYEECAEELT